MRKRRLLPGLIISGVLLVLVFYRLDLQSLRASIRTVSPAPLALGAVLLTTTLLIRTWRWRYLLDPIKQIAFTPLLSATAIGAMTDMLLPARAGDVVRAYLIGQKEQISKIAAMATIVLEKLLDVLTIAAVAIGLFIPLTLANDALALPDEFRTGLLLTLAVLLVAFVFIWVAGRRTEGLLQLIQFALQRLPQRWSETVAAAFRSFADGVQSLRGGRHTVRLLLLSVLLWALFAGSNYLILRAFDLQLPVYAALLILVFQVLGVTLPSSPGAIGTYHAAVLIGLSLFGVSREVALSVAIVMHAAFFFPFILIGLAFLWRENLSLGQLWALDGSVAGTDNAAPAGALAIREEPVAERWHDPS